MPAPPGSSPARGPSTPSSSSSWRRGRAPRPRSAFPTGFAANLGTLCALGGRGVRVLSDELNHASIIDGCRLSRSDLAVYRHADMDHLEQLLAGRPHADTRQRAQHRRHRATKPTPTIVVTDSVFSMDGDAAPLEHLLSLCARARCAPRPRRSSRRPRPPPPPGNQGRQERRREAGTGPALRLSGRMGERSCASARCQKPSARLAVSSPPAVMSSTSSSTGPAPTSSRPR